MKKLFKKIGFHKLRQRNEDFWKTQENKNGYLVWFTDNTCAEAYNQDDLLDFLENDNKHRIRYIFDMVDRIVIDRDIQVDIKEDK